MKFDIAKLQKLDLWALSMYEDDGELVSKVNLSKDEIGWLILAVLPIIGEDFSKRWIETGGIWGNKKK